MRPKQELIDLRTQRVYEIARMVLRNDWSYGSSILDLAERWKLHKTTLHGYYAEALRIIAGELGPELRAAADQMIVETFQLKEMALAKGSYRVIIDEAGSMQKELLPDPDVKAAIAAVRLRGDILGITGAHKTDHRPNRLRGKSIKEIYVELKHELLMIGKELGSDVTITEDPPIVLKEIKAKEIESVENKESEDK